MNRLSAYTTDWLTKIADYFPTAIALEELETGRNVSYKTLNQQANILSDYLVNQLGLTCGDRIVIIAEHCITYGVLIGVAQKTGIIIVPLNYRLTAFEIAKLVKDASPKLCIYQTNLEHLLKGLEDRKMSLTQLTSIIEDSKPISFANIDYVVEHPMFIIYTSGSTGVPKGVLYTHEMCFWNAVNSNLRLELNSSDCTVLCMPPFHTGGLNVLLTPFIHQGSKVVISKSFDADNILSALSKYKCTMFMGVPTMLKLMASSDLFHEVDLRAMRYFIVGGEAMPVPLIEEYHKRGIPIRQGYGMTEVGPNITSLHQDDAVAKQGSIGKVNFYIEHSVLSENGEPVPANTKGELVIKGKLVAPGYWKNEEASKSAFDGKGWFHTGDIVTQDEEGYLYVVDRIKNMFISGGENVYPAEIEKILIQHPSVKEVCVVGIHDSKWGEVGLAAIVLNGGFNSDEIDYKTYCANKLAKYKIPKKFKFLKELPKNATGKIDRKKLFN